MVFDRQGPAEFSCDAPPYRVVEACARLGFQTPLDVRWCRLSEFLNRQRAQSSALGGHLWALLFGSAHDRLLTCPCGNTLPILEKYTFTFVSHRVAEYRLGQCPKCRIIFWEQA